MGVELTDYHCSSCGRTATGVRADKAEAAAQTLRLSALDMLILDASLREAREKAAYLKHRAEADLRMRENYAKVGVEVEYDARVDQAVAALLTDLALVGQKLLDAQGGPKEQQAPSPHQHEDR